MQYLRANIACRRHYAINYGPPATQALACISNRIIDPPTDKMGLPEGDNKIIGSGLFKQSTKMNPASY